MNGETIVDADIEEASKNGTIDEREHPGLMNRKGRIGFMGRGSKLEFRNIMKKNCEKACFKVSALN